MKKGQNPNNLGIYPTHTPRAWGHPPGLASTAYMEGMEIGEINLNVAEVLTSEMKKPRLKPGLRGDDYLDS